MALKKAKNLLPNPEPGNIPARLARIIEIGEHPAGPNGKFGIKPQVHLYFSLPTRIVDAPESDFHGKQHMVRSQALNYSASEKSALVKDYIRVMDPGFDLSNDETPLGSLLTKSIYLTIDNNETDTGTYTNIMNTMGVPEGMPVGDLDTNQFYFDYDNPDVDVWVKYIGDFMKEKIMKAKNYPGSAVEAMVLKLEAMQGSPEPQAAPVEALSLVPDAKGTSDFDDDIPF